MLHWVLKGSLGPPCGSWGPEVFVGSLRVHWVLLLVHWVLQEASSVLPFRACEIGLGTIQGSAAVINEVVLWS